MIFDLTLPTEAEMQQVCEYVEYTATPRFLDLFSPDRCNQIHLEFDLIDEDYKNWLIAIEKSDWASASRITWGLYAYLYSRGYWDEIETIWEKLLAESQHQKNTDTEAISMLFHQLGTVLLDRGKIDKGHQYLFSGLELAEKLGWDLHAANTMFQLGISYRQQGDYKKSQQILERGLKLSHQCKEGHLLQQYILGQLANLAIAHNDTQKAITILKESLKNWKQFEDLDERRLAHTTMHTLGRAYLHDKRYIEADKVLRESLNLKYLSDNGTSGIAKTQCLLGEAKLHLGDYDEAEKNLADSLKVFTKLNDASYRAIASKNLGLLNYRLGNYLHAANFLDLAYNDAQRVSNHQRLIEISYWGFSVSLAMRQPKFKYVYVAAKSLYQLPLPWRIKAKTIFSMLVKQGFSKRKKAQTL